jgi:hypothetical protein
MLRNIWSAQASADIEEHEITFASADEAVPSASNKGRDDADAPEALVRKENQQLRIVRVIALFALLMVAVIMTSSIYVLLAKSERNKYEGDYKRIVRDIVGRLLDDSALYVTGGYTLSRAMQALIQAYDTEAYTMAVPFRTFLDLSVELQVATTTDFITWSPLLRDDTERQAFEDFVRKKAMDDRSTAYPPCYVCGGPEFRVTNPKELIQFPGINTVTCQDVDLGGRAGAISHHQCVYILDFLAGKCECGPIRGSDVPARSVEEGICRIEHNTSGEGNIVSIVNETWNSGPYLPIWQDSYIEAAGYPLMYNLLSEPALARTVAPLLLGGRAVATSFMTNESASYYNYFPGTRSSSGPSALIFIPVFDGKGFDGIGEPHVAGTITSVLMFSALLQKPPPTNGEFLDIVIESSCDDQKFSYRIDPIQKSGLSLLGPGDLHEHRYSDMVHRSDFDDFNEILAYSAVHRDLDT